MSTRQIPFLTALVALAAASGIAIHYRNKAVHYELEWRSATALAAATRDAGGTMPVRGGFESPTGRIPFTPEAGETDPELDPDGEENMFPQQDGFVPFATNHIVGENLEWMEALKKRDPAAYEASMKRRQDMLKQREQQQFKAMQAWAGATNYFASRNTNNLSKDEIADFVKMRDLLEQIWALKQDMKGSVFNPEERRLAGGILQSNMVVLAQLLEAERNREYSDLALGMGLSAAEAASFAGYINQILSNTSVNVIFPDTVQRGGGMRGGRGGRSNRDR